MSRLLCSLLFVIYSLPAIADEHILTPMLGFSSWSDDTDHTARDSAISFSDSNELTLGFRYLYMFDSGIAIGGDIYIYGKDVINNSQASDAGVGHIHALVEYFFNPTGNVTPFIGAGLGGSSVSFDGGTLDGDSTAGGSFELNGGVLFSLSEFLSLQLEYKFTSFEMDEDIDGFPTNIDTTANSILVGLSIHI